MLLMEENFGRRPDPTVVKQRCNYNARVRQGLAAHASAPRNPPRPATKIEMLRLKKSLDLENNAEHRVLWAILATCFQGTCRPSDILPDKEFNSDTDISRSCLRFASVTNDNGKPGQPKLILTLRATKTDQLGQRR